MANQGPNSGGTFADDATVGTIAWTNPGNAITSNNSYATAIVGIDLISHYLKATNFSFSIPNGATINGIVVEVERKSSVADASLDNSIRLVKGGIIGGDDKLDGITAWPTSDAYKTYGSASDLWGLSLTDSDINASNFGVVVSGTDSLAATLSIDHIIITVYYTLVSGIELFQSRVNFNTNIRM